MGGRRSAAGRGTSVALAAALAWGCAAQRPPAPSLDIPPLKLRPARPAREAPADPSSHVHGGEQVLANGARPVQVQVGKSLVLHLRRSVKRVSLANPAVAEIMLISPTEVLVNGQEPGETSLVLWDNNGIHEVHTLEVSMHRLDQVLLEVTVVEVNRTALERHGLDFRLINEDLFLVGRPSRISGFPEGTQYPPGEDESILPLTIGDNVTLALVEPDSDFSAFAEALQREGLARVLAQPRLLARSGEEARFLAGGEIPIVIATALQTSVVFKEFGTRVSFTPTVTDGGEIDLKLVPEVSDADFAQGVTIAGSTIPSFVTRRAETSVRLREGEVLVIAGLMLDTEQEDEQKVPFLGDVPALGYLFRRTIYERSRRELLIVVRPEIVRPLPPGTEIALPTARGPLTRGEVRTKREESEVTRPRPGLPGGGRPPHKAPPPLTPSAEWPEGQPLHREPEEPPQASTSAAGEEASTRAAEEEELSVIAAEGELTASAAEPSASAAEAEASASAAEAEASASAAEAEASASAAEGEVTGGPLALESAPEKPAASPAPLPAPLAVEPEAGEVDAPELEVEGLSAEATSAVFSASDLPAVEGPILGE